MNGEGMNSRLSTQRRRPSRGNDAQRAGHGKPGVSYAARGFSIPSADEKETENALGIP